MAEAGVVRIGMKRMSLEEQLVELESDHVDRGLTPHSSDRSRHPVLMPWEVDAVKAKAGPESGKALVVEGARKLVSIGAMWRPNEDGSGRAFFLQDTCPGLSTLEEDVVRIQIESFLMGMPYDNALIKASEIADAKERDMRPGGGGKEALMAEILGLAARRDDELDSKA
jgi:hypothetical protein